MARPTSQMTTAANVGFLRSECARRGWDQRRLALESGLDPSTISRVMAGRPALASTLEAIAAALDRNEPRAELAALVAG